MSKTRSCGQCRACCTTCDVEPLNKPAQKPCLHLLPAPSKGCGIYAKRPAACAIFKCAWLAKWEPLKAFGQFLDRPDRYGLVLDLQKPLCAQGERVWVASLAPGHTLLSLQAREYLRILSHHELLIYVPRSGEQEWDGPSHLLSKVVVPSGMVLKRRA